MSKASGIISMADLSDGRALSAHLGASQPLVQVYNPNKGEYAPDWATTAGKLVITPVIYINNDQLALTDSNLSITWKRKNGLGTEGALTAGETVAGNILTVAQNKMASEAGNRVTYIAYLTYYDTKTKMTANAVCEISFAMVQTGNDAKTCYVGGEQTFKYDTAGVVTPAQITLTATVAGVNISKWQYKNSAGTWVDYPVGDGNTVNNGSTLVIKPTHAVFVGDAAAVRVTTSDASIGDTLTIVKVRDGIKGDTGNAAEPTSAVALTNENITFAGNASGQIAAVTIVCKVFAHTGSSKVTPTVGAITGAPTGMTVTKGAAVDNEIPISITIAANATLGAAGALQGELLVPITAPINTTLKILWSKVNTGQTGTTPATPVVFSLYAPNGNVFTNGEGSLPIQTAGYSGTTPITSGATYVWAKYKSGAWETIAGQTGATLTVQGADVEGVASYQCTMTYGGKTYIAIITMIDKTDNYQLSVDSTAGTIFKNTVGETCLIARLYQSGQEVDGLKNNIFSVSAPASPVTGATYYQITKTSPVTKLMRYSGTAWVDVTNDATYKHTEVYTWYRRDQNGSPLDGGAAFATGKVIFVDGDDVDGVTVFACEVA